MPFHGNNASSILAPGTKIEEKGVLAVKKLEPITSEEWLQVNELNRQMVEDFLADSTELSSATIKTYSSNLKIFFVWVKNNLNNKNFADVRSLDFKRFINWLAERNCSSADIRTKKSSVSSFFTYVETYYLDDYPNFRNPINKSIKLPPSTIKKEKIPLTIDEFNNLIDVLEEKKEYAKVAYLLFAFETGARKGEIRQLLKDIINASPKVDQNGRVYYETPKIRAKGRGKEGKQRTFIFSEKTMSAFKKYVETRDDDCEYLFVQTVNEKVKQASPSLFNYWHEIDFDKIVGRKTYPHLLRTSRATFLSEEQNVDIKRISKLLGHSSTQITEIYIKRKENEGVEDLLL